MTPSVSIIICTYNREPLLGDCLLALENQTADTSLFEVIVVNNNSIDGTQLIAEHYANRNKNFRVYLETKQGLSFARNRGLREAMGTWIAYIDDDARAFPDYVEKLFVFLQEYPDACCFGGPCVPLYHESKPAWYLDAYQTGNPGRSRVTLLAKPDFVSGFSIVFNKRKLIELGGFNTMIGMIGKKVGYGEETQVQVRIRKTGGKIYFFSELLVHHYIDSYKLRFFWFFKSGFAIGRDSWQTFEEVPNLSGRWRALCSALRVPVERFPLAWRQYRNGKYRIQNLIIECFMPSFYYIGRTLYWFEK